MGRRMPFEGRKIADVNKWEIWWKHPRHFDRQILTIRHHCKVDRWKLYPIVHFDSGGCWSCDEPMPSQIRALALIARLCK